MKGLMCSINGKNYEKLVYNIVNKCKINNEIFNKQKITDLGYSSNKNDIECIYNNNIFGIEIKRINSPDYMQCTIKYDFTKKKWITSNRSKIPDKSKEIFETIINEKNLFNNKIPPFYNQKITHEEWLKIKKKDKTWKDIYFDIPNDIIRKVYLEKGCK
jgi:hypothetical protein